MRKYDLRKRLSAVFIVPLLLSSCGSAGGGGGTAETDSREITEYSLLGKDISDGVSMKSGQCLLTVEPYDGGYRVRIKSGDTVMFSSDTPVSLMIRAAGRNTEKEYAVCYEKLEGDGRTLTATATVETVAETLIRVTDRYYGDGELVTLERTVKTERASGSDEGFSSRVMFEYVGGTPSFDCMDWFVPGVWNKDPVMDSPEGVASSYGVSAITVKDTRTGLPMVTARGKDTGATLSVGRINPEISSDISDFRAKSHITDENYLCGSVGGVIRKNSGTVGICYCYPASEEPYGYFSDGNPVKRYHPVKDGFSSSYTVTLRADITDGYNEAVMSSYMSYFSASGIYYFDADVDSAYDECIKTMLDYYGTKKTDRMTICGLPYGCFVSDGHVESDLTMEMGFVGMEISAAYQFMRYGYLTGNSTAVSYGEAMADMWAENSGLPSGVLKTYLWSNGVFDSMPCYLRRMTDGMEGMLDCCRIAMSNGKEYKTWLSLAEKYADFLVSRQNPDGSWYRAYDYGGEVFSDESVKRYHQYYDKDGINPSSKNSTPIPIRFLVRMYEFTGEEKYRTAAEKAAGYVIDVLVPMGKYGGATVDGHERTDKETGVFAMYGMNSLYALTGEKKYLDAAEQAAVYAASWMMVYDYKIVESTVKTGEYFIENASLSGQSLITSGHSTVDGFMAYTYYDYFRLYLWTGNVFYYDFARLAENNSKRNLNYDGRLGYASKGLCLEAINAADFFFITSGNAKADNPGVWLPWCGIAHIEPISIMTDVFGTARVEDAVKQPASELAEKLKAFGAGGRRK